MQNNYDLNNNISERLRDTEKLTEVIRSSIQDALKKHKQAGNSVCEWRDNEVVWISPEDIPEFNDSP